MMTRALLTAVTVVASASLAASVAIAPVAPDTLELDGDLADWNPGLFSVAPELFFGEGTTFVEQGTVKSNADHSARIFFAVRGPDLLVAALVRDDSVVTVRGGEQWRGDGLELLFAQADGSLLHVGVNPVGDVHQFSKQKAAPGARPITAAARGSPEGWSVELAVPFEVLGLSGAEASIPFNVAMRDVDEGEVTSAYRVWSGQRHAALASLGTLLFDKARPNKAWPKCPTFSSTVTVNQPLSAQGPRLLAGNTPVSLRIINFQSAKRNWQTFWSDFDREQIKADLEVAKRLKANAVRIFVFDAVFGLETVRPEMLERLGFVVREAAARGMLSIVSFFPFKKEVRPEWDQAMRRHLEQVVAAFRGDPAIAMWELMNEPDHLWALGDGGVSSADVARWAHVMHEAIHSADPSHLITVGLYGHFLTRPVTDEAEALPFVEVISVHWYGEAPPDAQWFARLTSVAQKPIVLQEFGATSLYSTPREASAMLDALCTGAAKAGLAGAGVWELFDHPVGSIAHQADRWLETPENDFGLVTAEGAPKPQAGAFCRCLRVPGFVLKARAASP